jgi:hypothetical protein
MLFSRGGYYDVDDVDLSDPQSYQAALKKREAEVIALGEEVAQNQVAYRELVPELVRGEGRHWHLGTGLARASSDLIAVWRDLTEEFAKASTQSTNPNIFCGILSELVANNSELANRFLDEALQSDQLGAAFPLLQSAVSLDERGMTRLRKSLELGRVPLYVYRNLAYGRATERAEAQQLANFLLALAEAPDGANIAIHVLGMQFFCDRQDKRPSAIPLIEVGRTLLTLTTFKRGGHQNDHELAAVVHVSLNGEDGYAVAKIVCRNLKQAFSLSDAHESEHNALLNALGETQPFALLDIFFCGGKDEITRGLRIIEWASYHQKNPMDRVSDAALLEWCQRDPATRFPTVAAAASILASAPGGNAAGLAPRAPLLVHSSPDPIAVMKAIAGQLRPTMWSGSRSTILEANAELLGQFDTRGNAELAAFVEAEKAKLRKEAEIEREWETKLDRSRDEKFEY